MLHGRLVILTLSGNWCGNGRKERVPPTNPQHFDHFGVQPIILPHITPFGTATWPNSADYGGLGLRLALPSEDSWRRSTPELRSFRRLILQWQLVAIFNKRDQTIAYYCQLSMAIINYKRLLRIVIWQVSSPKWRKSVQNPQHRPFTLVDRISMDYWYIMICYDYPQCLG